MKLTMERKEGFAVGMVESYNSYFRPCESREEAEEIYKSLLETGRRRNEVGTKYYIVLIIKCEDIKEIDGK